MKYIPSLQDDFTPDCAYCTPTFSLHKPYILVVEDDEAILSVLMMLFEAEGYPALGLLESQKVLPFLEQSMLASDKGKPIALPSVVLLDLMMPLLSGYGLAACLASYVGLSSLPIIVMTADSTVRHVEAVRGACELISKPFQIDHLLTLLDRYQSSVVLV